LERINNRLVELERNAPTCPYDGQRCLSIDTFFLNDIMYLIDKSKWNDVSKRPPKEGRYIVWAFNSFRHWQTRIATWFDNTGWDTAVKYWRELPEPPEEEQT